MSDSGGRGDLKNSEKFASQKQNKQGGSEASSLQSLHAPG